MIYAFGILGVGVVIYLAASKGEPDKSQEKNFMRARVIGATLIVLGLLRLLLAYLNP